MWPPKCLQLSGRFMLDWMTVLSNVSTTPSVTTTETFNSTIYLPNETKEKECVMKCGEHQRRAMTESFSRNLNIRQLFPFEIFIQIADNRPYAIRFCSVNTLYKMCLDRCANSRAKVTALEINAFNDYVCGDEQGPDALRAMNCLLKTTSPQACLQKCRDFYSQSSTLMGNFYKWAFNSQWERIALRLPYACRSLICTKDCEFSLIEEQCGKQRLETVQDIILKTFVKSVNKTLEIAGMESVWPQICEILGHSLETTVVSDALAARRRETAYYL